MTKPGPPPIQTISLDYHFCVLHDIVSAHLLNSVTKHTKKPDSSLYFTTAISFAEWLYTNNFAILTKHIFFS